ncbi:GPP34 family phosphoprotein [Amycolatopsis sp. TRM77291]
MVLTATYCRDMFRSAVHDPGRIARVLSCMLLAELVEAEQLRITPDGLVYPRGHTPGRDTAVNEILLDMRREPVPHPADKWLDYLALQGRATALVWQRLVAAGDAHTEKARWPRRAPTVTLTGMQPTDWARRFLITASTMDSTLPLAAALLWRALEALVLEEEIGLPTTAIDRLAATLLPTDMTALFAALDRSLTRLSTQL